MATDAGGSEDKSRLGQRLVAQGFLAETDLDRVLRRQKTLPPDQKIRRLGSLLIEAGLVSAQRIAFVLAEQRGVPPASTLHNRIDRAVRRLFPKALLQRVQAAPVALIGKTVAMAMADPQDTEQVALLQSLTLYTVKPMQASQIQVQQLLALFKDEDGPLGPASRPPLPRPSSMSVAAPGLPPAGMVISASGRTLLPPRGAALPGPGPVQGPRESARSPRKPVRTGPRNPAVERFVWDDRKRRIVLLLCACALFVTMIRLWRDEQESHKMPRPVWLDDSGRALGPAD